MLSSGFTEQTIDHLHILLGMQKTINNISLFAEDQDECCMTLHAAIMSSYLSYD